MAEGPGIGGGFGATGSVRASTIGGGSTGGARVFSLDGVLLTAATEKPFDAHGMPNDIPTNAAANTAMAANTKRRSPSAKLPR